MVEQSSQLIVKIIFKFMITSYKDRNRKVWVIKEMDDDHILNAHRYFAIKRKEMSERIESGKFVKTTGEDLLGISLLINALYQEIDERELLKY